MIDSVNGFTVEKAPLPKIEEYKKPTKATSRNQGNSPDFIQSDLDPVPFQDGNRKV